MKNRTNVPARSRTVMSVLASCCLALTVVVSSAFAHADVHERIAAVDKLIEEAPRDPKLYLKRGELHRLHRDWDAALADYRRADELQPGLDEVRFLRGRLLQEAGRSQDAKRELDGFLAGQPDHREALLMRARAFVSLGEGVSRLVTTHRSSRASANRRRSTISSAPRPWRRKVAPILGTR